MAVRPTLAVSAGDDPTGLGRPTRFQRAWHAICAELTKLNIPMLSFKTFLESLADVAQVPDTSTFTSNRKGRFADVYLNPTPTELAKIAPGHGRGALRYLGAWVVRQKVYVWDRDIATHSDVQRSLGFSTIPRDSHAFYIYFTPSASTMSVAMSGWTSMGGAVSQEEVTKLLHNAPAFRSKTIDRYWFRDEA